MIVPRQDFCIQYTGLAQEIVVCILTQSNRIIPEEEKMKILYVTTIGSTMNFFNSFIRKLLDEGHTVDLAANEDISEVPDCYNEWGCTIYQTDTSRSPLSKGNIKAVKQLTAIVENGEYDIVHCHTPIAAVCTRLACRKARKRGTKVIYTAHGFHFFKGAPLLNWLVYFPSEWLCSFFTDVLITINKEDYEFAQRKMKAKRVEYVPGVGVDTDRFAKEYSKNKEKRKQIGVPYDAVMLLSVGELSKRKNQEVIIKALQTINNKNIHYVLAGLGKKEEELKQLANELNVMDRVHFLGYRSDISELCSIADIYCFPSLQEGLPVALMEAMAAGLPVVCSKIRGNTDLIQEGQGGFLCNPDDINAFAENISALVNDCDLRIDMGNANKTNIIKFSGENVEQIMRKIYLSL